MLVIRIELWSATTGDRTELGCASICNVGGNHTRGKYEFEVHKKFSDLKDRKYPKKFSRTKNFPRKSLGCWDLLLRLLLQVSGHKNKTFIKKWLLDERQSSKKSDGKPTRFKRRPGIMRGGPKKYKGHPSP